MTTNILWLGAVLGLVGCSNAPMYLYTTPGSPLPAGISVCNERDIIGRCKEWSTPSEYCVNPEGTGGPDPVIPCSSIKK